MHHSAVAGSSAVPRPGGFTITEMLLAAGIMVVALLGITGVLPTAHQNIHYGGQQSKAVSLAQSMLEMIKNDPYNDLSQYNGVDTRNPSTYASLVDDTVLVEGDLNSFIGHSIIDKWASDISTFLGGPGVTGGYGTIHVMTMITDPACPTLNNVCLRKVIVTVGWQESSRPHTIQLTTLVSGI